MYMYLNTITSGIGYPVSVSNHDHLNLGRFVHHPLVVFYYVDFLLASYNLYFFIFRQCHMHCVRCALLLQME